MAGVALIVGAAAYLTSVFYFMVPDAPKIQPGAIVPRPWDLLPAGIYVAATIGYGWRLRRAHSALDRALFIAAGLNVICHVTISESQRVLDAPFTVAHLLMVLSYVVVLGGTLLDNARLFDQVSRLAASDSLDRPCQSPPLARSDRKRDRAFATDPAKLRRAAVSISTA